jgi:hypothetical protein
VLANMRVLLGLMMTRLGRAGDDAVESMMVITRLGATIDRQGATIEHLGAASDHQGATVDCTGVASDHHGATIDHSGAASDH